MIKLYRILFFLAIACNAGAQCYINVSSLKVCLGSASFFSSSALSSNDSLFIWNFGDGGSSTQFSPGYQYQQAGEYQVNLRKYSKGGAYCDAIPVVIKVFSKPVSRYIINSVKQQCFSNNSFVFTDQSAPGISGAPVTQRIIVFSDGAYRIDSTFFVQQFAHSYSAPGKFMVVMEVKDSNGCVNQYSDSVTVHERPDSVKLKLIADIHCRYTDISLEQNGSYGPHNTNSFKWFSVMVIPWQHHLLTLLIIVIQNQGCTGLV